MAHINYASGTVIPSVWLNDVDKLVYTWFGNGTSLNAGSTPSTTTLTATTSIVTPLVTTTGATPLVLGTGGAAEIQISPNGVNEWNFGNGTGQKPFYPAGDNTQDIGLFNRRIQNLFASVIDSGTTGSLSLRTNNGQTGFQVDNGSGSVVNWARTLPSATGAPITIGVSPNSSDANVQVNIVSQGSGAFMFASAPGVQFEIDSAAGVTRHITVTGSNGGNPTIGVTAGSLAITPSVLIAGAFLQIGSTSALTGALRVPYGASGNGGLAARLQDNSGDQQLIDVTTQNAVTNVVFVGASIGGPNNSNGVVIRARSGAGAPTTSDIPAGDWALWRDTSGATTKLYYNNAGTIQSVALA